MFVGAAVGTGVEDGVAVEVGDGVGVLVGVAVGTAVGDGVGVVVGERVRAAVGVGVTTSVCVVRVSVGAAVRTGGMVVGEGVAVVVGDGVGVAEGDAVGTAAGVLAEHATRDMTSAPNSSSADIGVRMAYVTRVFLHSPDSDFVGSVCHPSNSNPTPPIIRLPRENGNLVHRHLCPEQYRTVWGQRLGRSGLLTVDSSASLRMTDHRAPNDNPLAAAPSVPLSDTL